MTVSNFYRYVKSNFKGNVDDVALGHLTG